MAFENQKNKSVIKQQIMDLKGLFWETHALCHLSGICLNGGNGGLNPVELCPEKYPPASGDKFWDWLAEKKPEIHTVIYDKTINGNYFIGPAAHGLFGTARLTALPHIFAFDLLPVIESCYFYPILARDAGITIRNEVPGFRTDKEKELHETSAGQAIDLFLEYAETNQPLIDMMSKSLSYMAEELKFFKSLA